MADDRRPNHDKKTDGHTITCALCGGPDTIFFEPEPGRRLLCKKCHTKRAGSQRAKPRRSSTSVRVAITCSRCGEPDMLGYNPRRLQDVMCRKCASENITDWQGDPQDRASGGFAFDCEMCGTPSSMPRPPKEEGVPLLCGPCHRGEHSAKPDRLQGMIGSRKSGVRRKPKAE